MSDKEIRNNSECQFYSWIIIILKYSCSDSKKQIDKQKAAALFYAKNLRHPFYFPF